MCRETSLSWRVLRSRFKSLEFDQFVYDMQMDWMVYILFFHGKARSVMRSWGEMLTWKNMDGKTGNLWRVNKMKKEIESLIWMFMGMFGFPEITTPWDLLFFSWEGSWRISVFKLHRPYLINRRIIYILIMATVYSMLCQYQYIFLFVRYQVTRIIHQRESANFRNPAHIPHIWLLLLVFFFFFGVR